MQTTARVIDLRDGHAVDVDVVDGETVVSDYNNSVGLVAVATFYADLPPLGVTLYSVEIGNGATHPRSSKTSKTSAPSSSSKHVQQEQKQRPESTLLRRSQVRQNEIVTHTSLLPPPASQHQSAMTEATIVLENEFVALTFSNASGTLVQWHDKSNNLTVNVNQT